MAGGTGRRFGAPKQFLDLAGRPVLSWSVEAARTIADGVVVVVPGAGHTEGAGGPVGGSVAEAGADWVADVGSGVDRVVAGGPSRADSVRAGLAAVPGDAAIVVVHDAVRPLAPPSLFADVVAAVRQGADGAVPAIPVGDTLKRTADGVVTSTVDRHDLVAVQTPQAFAADILRRAHADCHRGDRRRRAARTHRRHRAHRER